MAAVAADNLMVENPVSGVDGVILPMHMLCLRDMGLMLGSTGTSTNSPPTAPPTGATSSSWWRRRWPSPAPSDRRSTPSPSSDPVMSLQRRTISVDGLTTHYLEAGSGEPVVLLHGGEFGVDAETAWERVIPALAERYRVLAPDMLGFGGSAKVVDFTDGRGMRIRHIARFCAALGISSAHFVGNSMGRSTCSSI